MQILLLMMAFLGVAVAVSASSTTGPDPQIILDSANPAQLSAFGFFDGGAQHPAPQLIAYSLRTPLFSDYAEKQRFMYLPGDGKLTAQAGTGRLIFPVGAALIKNFGYVDKNGILQIIETRVLLRRVQGWVALPYVWRADHKDADLRVGGTRIPINFISPRGHPMQISYGVPNKNQCKQCHSLHQEIVPIGPVLGNIRFPDSQSRDRLWARLDAPKTEFPLWAKWDDRTSGTLDARAKSYLRINCGHCHNPNGSASNSGLFLDGQQYDAANSGVGKRPVAAGQGSGNLDFVIAPGKPDQSILIYRMKSLDPGAAMPELGRATVHEEGVELLEQWIGSMPTL